MYIIVCTDCVTHTCIIIITPCVCVCHTAHAIDLLCINAEPEMMAGHFPTKCDRCPDVLVMVKHNVQAKFFGVFMLLNRNFLSV